MHFSDRDFIVKDGTNEWVFRMEIDGMKCHLVRLEQDHESYKVPVEDIPEHVITHVETITGWEVVEE